MKKILVIDDEEWLREMVQLALSQKGFDVVVAENGSKGIEIAKRDLPDLILCDVNMDRMDGYGTLSSLRSEPTTAAIPFILMTGLADNAGMRHGMELGADDYLPKPFTIAALCAAVDTRLKKAQTLKKEAEKKLEHLRENLTLMLPHELRTPLNGILGFGELLAASADSLQPPEIAEMGQMICQSGKRLERLIENFLIYGQIQLLALDPHKTDALKAAVTADPVKVVEQRARAQAKIVSRESDLAFELQGQPLGISEEYLGKIVDELVQNALKFSSKGTTVRVSLSEGSGSSALVVNDRGRGFSTEHITRVGAYMQFERNRHEQQGQGLGLSIAKGLTELHGGTLTIQSDAREGTTVRVKLPARSAG
jgi:signal transduction histidine kinase